MVSVPGLGRVFLRESGEVAREGQEVIGTDGVDVGGVTRGDAAGRVETNDGVVGVTVQDREEGVGSESIPRDRVVWETDEVDEFGGDPGVGDTNNVWGVVDEVAEGWWWAVELLLDAGEYLFDRGGGS